MRSEVLYQLSSPQHAVWLDQSLAPSLPCCNIGVVVQVAGRLDLARFEAAIGQVAQANDALRIVLEQGEDDCRQRFTGAAGPWLQRFDFSHLDDAQGQAWAHVKQVFGTPFDVYGRRLWCMHWIDVAPGQAFWLFCFHHLVADGMSISLIGNAVVDAYNRLMRGEAPGTQEADASYRDFVARDSEYFASPRHDKDRDFWAERFPRLPEPLFEAGARQGRSDQPCGQVVWQLDRQAYARLGEVAAAEGGSSTNFLMAVLAAYFARTFNRGDEVVIGMPVHNRTGAAQRRTIGMFSSAIPVGIAVDPEQPFTRILQDVAAELKRCYRHQRYPLAEIHRRLLAGASERRGLFDVALSVEGFIGDLRFDGDVRTTVHPLHNGYERQPLGIYVRDYEQEKPVYIEFNFDPDVLTPDEMRNHVRRIECLTLAAIAAPQTRVRDLPAMDAMEYALVTAGFNDMGRDYGTDALVQQLFERQVAASRDAVALECDGERLSYAELNARANRLALHLRELGVQPDDRVAVCLERGLDLVVAIVAALKAGAAYVPLDPVLPDERLAHMLHDSAPVALLTHSRLRSRLALPEGVSCAELDAPAPWSDYPADDLPAGAQTPAHLAYVIYTSGSTGQPKGVCMPHRALVNLLRWQHDDLPLPARTLQFAALGFDVAFQEIFSTLTSGGTLVLVGETLRQDLPALADWMRGQDLQRIYLPYIALNGLAELWSQQERPLPALQDLITAGEQLRITPAIRHLFRQAPQARLHNHYGPTESHVVTAHVLAGPADEWEDLPPIGTPIANSRIYLLDTHGQPVPQGVTGEIHIGGVQVARAYLGRPDLSAERFLADPFVDGASMYRTGDLGRWRADGSVEYLGRNDFQVKIRGYRIELGEIETQLARIAGVREAVVLAREDVPGEKRLVAYVVLEAGLQPDPQAWRAALGEALPDYMLPAAFMPLSALPQTPNGKLDRKALPAPDDTAFVQRAYEPPADDIERTLARIWSELLGVERVGRHDDFFELGGHSLLAIRLIEQMRRRDWFIDIRSLFAQPRLAALAQAIRQGHELGIAEVAVPANAIPAGCTAITPDMLPLVRLDTTQIATIAHATPGGAANIQDIYPLAPLQEGILFHHLMQRGRDTYVLPTLLRFDSQQRLDAFLAALDEVIARHDILRTAVQWEGLDEPVQVVWRTARLDVESVAVDTDTDDVPARLQAHVEQMHARIDLRKAPLLRAFAAPDPAGPGWWLQLLYHHLALDHTALELVVAEVALLVQGRASELLAPVPFRNFVAQARLGLDTAAHEEFFRRMLADVDEPTAPFGLLDVQGDGSRLAQARLALAPELAQRLRRAAKGCGVSAASVFHLAMAQVLAASTGRTDVVFGTVLFGRMQGGAGADQAMGLFINTLPLRVRIGAAAVADSLRETHDALVGLLRHEHAPLALAQRCSALPPGTPLFSALLNYRHSQIRGHDVELLEGVRFVGDRDRTNYPLSLYVDDFGQDFGLTVQVHDSVAAQRVAAFLLTALEGLVRALEHEPALPLAALDVLPPDERRQVLHEFNATATDYPAALLHQLVERQAARTPDAAAVRFEGIELSYAQLNAQANRLAHHLRGLGVGPDRTVGVLLERSEHLVIALLAIVKAGGAYVPLDPSYPDDRLAHMLRDSAPLVLLTQERLAERLAVPRLVLDTAATDAMLAALDDANLDPAGLARDHLAYVIYTSGSTGQPKGVMNSHRGIVNRLQWMQQAYELGPQDVVLQKTPFGFDVSVWEFFWPLMTGAQLVVARPEGHKDPHYLGEVIEAAGVTTLHFVPSMLQVFLSQPDAVARCASVRQVLCSGEALPAALVQGVRARLPQAQLHNLYGPTEAAVDVTAWTCTGEEGSAVPIGRPIANTRMYVLDTHGRPAPLGVAGELYIGGVQVARGYLNLPKLTEERFLADPFVPGGRMYRTGDLGRWRPDGAIDYLGRNDFQVKLRGFRIELGEIEAQLVRQPGVREAVVLARPDGAGLVAYLVADPAPEPAALRAALGKHLPDYMIPAAYVTLDALPLGPNGKLDRKALPALDGAAFGRQAFEAPVGEVEQALAAIWSELLGIERIGRHDHFFELGGHSLLAIRLLEQLRRRDWSLDIHALFAHPSLADMAAAIGASHDLGSVQVPPNGIPATCEAITPAMLPLIDLTQAQIDTIAGATPGGAANIQDIYPLAPLQKGILFHHLLQAEGNAYVLPTLLAFDSQGRFERFVAALDAVIARHDILRTAVHWEGLAEPAQVVWRQAPLHVEVLNFDPAAEAVEVQLLRHADPRHYRLDVTRAPLLHGFAAFDAAGQRWLLQLLYHHLVMDHTTLEVLTQEIALIQQQREQELPLPVPYRDFVAHARLGTSEAQHEAFFRAMLADVDEPTAPFGILDVQGDGSQVEQARLTLPADLSVRLRRQARAHGTSAASLFHLAWAQVLGQCTGRDDVVFGTVLFGRMQGGAGADRAVGMFINTLPLRVALGDTGVESGLRQVGTALADLLRHEHAALALAQRCSGLAAGTPLFSALLNYRHSHTAETHDVEVLEGVRFLGVRDRTNYPFGLYVDDLGQDFALTAEIHRSVSAQRIVGFVAQVLEGLVRALEHAPATPLHAVSALPASERDLVVHGFNDTQADHDLSALVHQLVERQAAANPGRIALEFGDEVLTYRALNEHANRLAHYLRELGVGPDGRVAICAERSPAMVVAILATLKAGGAYVPLDPTYPDERLARMLADSRPVALLTQRALRDRLGAGAATVVLLDEPAPPWSGNVPANLPADGLRPEHLAYVIYTSGSTGVPKGVAMPHRGLVNLLAWQQGQLPEPARTLQFAALGFDVAFQEIFSTLAGGGTLVLLREALRQDLPALADWLGGQSIERMFLPFIALDSLSELWSQRTMPLPLLRDLITAGEQLRITPAIRRMFGQHANARLHNHYGPTESHVVTAHVLAGPPDTWEDLPPIGQPIANSRIYLLDAQRQPVPLGVPGEIYIAGTQVARGYLEQPALSEERFVADPFVAGERMYRTGDVGRWRDDGTLDYLGRNDFQVKLRGYRIELGEIEAQLARLPGVRAAAVRAYQDRPGDKRLVAYVVADPDGARPDALRLRTQLGERLPDYMVPAAYVLLDALPLTPNGKLDRKALPAPDDAARIQQAYEAPQGEVEQALARIWAELLGVEQVGRHDSFFELGGHSLLAVRLVSQVRQQQGVELQLATLFAQPRLAELAREVGKAARSTLGAIVPADRTAPLPLSYAQQRLWFIDRMDRHASAAYHIHATLRLRGPLDVAALQAALDGVVARHEALRTRFVGGDGEACQAVDPPRSFALGHEDVALELLDERCAALVAQPFDLAAGPPIRGHLLRLASDDHVLLLAMHHIVSDGWSLGVLMREVAAGYRAARDGADIALKPLPIQYADYAAWQRQWLQGPPLQAQLQECVAQLQGAPELLTLPTDRPRPAVQDYRGASIEANLDADLAHALRALGQRHGTTLYMMVLAAWAAVLARLSGQAQVVIGSAHAGRGRAEVEPLIGFFVNTQALKVDLDGDLTVAALLAQVRHTALRAQALHEVPFEQVVEALNPVRSMAHQPIFQVMLTWHNTPQAALELADLAVERLRGRQASATFDLALDFEEAGEGIAGQLNYATALFDAATVRRYWGYLHTMLRAMVADDRQAVHGIALPDEAERTLLLHGFNATQRERGAAQPVHRLFERLAAARPDALALVHDTRQLRYGELNERANRLAHHLRALGVRPDTRVALCMERGIEAIVAILATLKAGGGYVPLDPAQPVERLAHMLADCAPTVLLTAPARHERLPVPPGCQVVAVDDVDWAGQPGHDPDPAEVGLDALHLAYVIYTSGSTGTPKGVLVEHRQLWHQVAALQELYGFTPADRVLQFCALTFDVSVEEIFGALLHGATLVLRTEAWVTDPAGWCRLCAQHGLTVANLPTLFWQRLALEPDAAIPSHLRQIVIGGDAVGAAALEAWWRRPGHRPALANAYGPTETTINATVARCTPDDAPGNIGRPVPEGRIYVLDAGGQPVPLGATGEIHVGGAHVARGYLNRPALDAERFLPDPFVTGGRMYRTGDLGRWHADGSVEFLGRNDFQVKIRGYRIELGEIEAQLARLDGVHEAAVLARADQAGEKRLVAYVVGTAQPAELRAQLAERLPDYMVPAAYVTLEALPLTANGKLDRGALPAPDGAALVQRAHEAPQGEVEQVLARIWSELLGVAQVGRQDSFFELGGHSLLAVRLVSQLRQQLGVELPLAALFESPRLAELAREAAVAGRSTLAPIVPADRTAPLPLSYSQQRLWYVTQIDAQAHTAYHIPGALRLRGALDRAALQAAVARVIERHEVLRTRFVTVGGQPRQVVEAAQGFTLPYSDASGLTAQALQDLCRAEATAPFDLARGPLLRGHLLRLAADDHLLLVTMHHIVADGWSLSVLAREVSALYDAFLRGAADPLPPLPVQYGDYAAWQRDWLQGPVLQQQLQYWVRQLETAPELLALPTDRPRPDTQDYRGATLPVALDEGLSQALRALGQRHGTTLYMTVLGAWAAVLARLSGQAQVVIGSSEAGRNRAELEALIGFFVNAQALRFDLDGDISVAALLAQARQLALQAQAHRDVPFEQVVEALNPARSMAYNPVYQVRLAWQNTPEVRLDLAGLGLESVGNQAGSAQFDLSLDLEQAGDRIVGQLNYATALFDEPTIRRHWGYLEAMLRAMVADDAQQVGRIALLGETERQLLLRDFNATQRDYPADTLIHALFEHQAAVQPDVLAVACEGEELSYGALNARANQLAHYLRKLGVRPDQRVALFVERSVDMAVALLATLKAGGAYVPLDPVHPDERIAHMLTDSAPAVVLTQARLRSRLPAGQDAVVLDALPWQQSPWAAEPATDPDPATVGLDAAHLAYVIYTSGSTGTPKGVMVEHRNVLTFLRGLEERIHGVAPDCRRVAWNSSFGFDMAVKAWGQLALGRSVYIVPERTRLDADALLDFLERHAIEAMECTPSHLRMLQGAGLLDGRASALRKLLLGGEALDTATWRTLAACDDIAFFNMYGPTECSVDAACGPVAGAVPQVGSVMPNARIYLLDAHGQPVPLGVAGEIHIGGAGVARGYLHRPELTAERFVPDPFAATDGARMYRTGDLGRWRADGTIEYLGRNDFQVKVRGFRIELGEIETRLARLPGVRQAVVLAREDSPGDQRLVAYVVPDPQAPASDPAALRAQLAAQLPEYMLPSSYVALERLPLSPNGKLDRKALPAPEGQGLVQRQYEAPVGAVEQALAAIWAELLGAERVGRHDNFFELGGHSALAIQVIYQMSARQLQADVQMVFNAPSLAHLAAATIQLEEVEL